jgi:peptidoglycan/LPS O-acetylase OafA/YrhL
LVSIGMWLTFYILCFLVSALLYRYFEKPIMDLRERFSISLPKPQDDIRH